MTTSARTLFGILSCLPLAALPQQLTPREQAVALASAGPVVALDPATGAAWAHEHGPRGGDEINRLRAGANYGWPAITHGIDYDGTLISERAFAPGFERSAFFWAPSIAPSGLAVYHGPAFPAWDGKLLVGALAAKSVSRMRYDPKVNFFVEEERMFSAYDKRIRDVRIGPDGYVYLLTDEDEAEILRLRPAQ